MAKGMACRSIIVLGFLAIGAPTLHAQYDQRDQRGARARDLIALQDDLRVLDDSLIGLDRRNPRYQEFQRRADAVRRDVTVVADEMQRYQNDRRDGSGVGQAEVAALRHSIAVLRDDVEEAQSQGRGRGDGAWLLPAGTEIQVMLAQGLSSRSSNLEDRIEGSTVAAIRINGRTVVPAGATVSGVVREVRSRHRGQQDGWLKIDFDSLTPEHGPRMPIRSHVVAVSELHSGNHTARNTGLGAILGAVIGGMIDGNKGALIGAAVGAGGGLLASQGDDVDLPEGSLVTIRLDGPMTLARR